METIITEQPSTQNHINEIEGEITGLQTYLKQTDWCVVKCQEIGQPLATVYPDEAARRAAARDRINELQAQLPALYAARQAEIEQLQAQPEVFYPDETVVQAAPDINTELANSEIPNLQQTPQS